MDCANRNYQDGLAFRFKHPKGTTLSLQGVKLSKDGVPSLSFSTVRNGYSLTEEDAAVCWKLAQDHKRPEFYFCSFLPTHPFSTFGRHFMHYKPAYLRNTGIGKVWVQADIDMKALNVALKMNRNMDAKGIEGILSHDSFPSEDSVSQILLTCEDVEIQEHNDQMVFVGEPVLKITSTASPAYTEYINKNIPSLPSFQQLKETLKMVLAMEWMRDKGVKFSEQWMKENTEKPEEVQKPIRVELSPERKQQILEDMHNEGNKLLSTLPSDLNLPTTEIVASKPRVRDMKVETKHSDSGVELSIEIRKPEQRLKDECDLYVPLDYKIEGRASVDDLDFVLEGLNPKMPATVDVGDFGVDVVRPDVGSWNELYAKHTAPIPCKLVNNQSKDEKIFTGGCATSTIPVRKSTREYCPPKETVKVPASTRKKVYKTIPTAAPKPVHQGNQVSSCKEVSTAVPATVDNPSTASHGWMDSSSHRFTDSNGKVEEQASLYSSLKLSKSIAGKKLTELTFTWVNGIKVEPTKISLYENQDGKLKAAINDEEMPAEIRPCQQPQRAIQLVGGGREVGSPVDMSKHLTRDKTAGDPQRDSGFFSGTPPLH